MPALHIRDVSAETVDAIKRRAARNHRSMQQELRAALDRIAVEPVNGTRPRSLKLHTVDTGAADPFDRHDLYGDDER